VDPHSNSPSFPRRRASDWGGFVGHLFVAALTVVSAPALTVFLLPGIIHMTLAAGSFLMRDAPRRREENVFGRIVAYAGGFGVFGFIQYASVFRPEWLTVSSNAFVGLIGFAFGILGIFIEIWAVWHLRFAFATEPAARRLVTTGPYRLVRHPVYSGGSLAYLGLLMTRPTAALALAIAVWAVCIACRMRYEEAILTKAFPDYTDYRHRVGALVPWPFAPTPKDTAAATGV
jgi:protein-S-isoprenylcysteine O-methyltransferase Ste14